jgi:hypothetical protein
MLKHCGSMFWLVSRLLSDWLRDAAHKSKVAAHQAGEADLSTPPHGKDQVSAKGKMPPWDW